MSIVFDTDSYKLSHWLQYPPGTEYVYSYIEARGGAFDRTVVFGLQMVLQGQLCPIVNRFEVEEMAEMCAAHGEPFNRAGWQHIVDKHGGKLPLSIRAVPEGTVVPTGNVLLTVVNTDPKCFWLPGHVETALMRLWYPTTVATVSYHCRRRIWDYLVETCDDPAAEIDFKLHDFGSRGVSSQESAAIGALAHLINFKGTDTFAALRAGSAYYDEKMAGFSIPAAEHSTITSWGRDGEADAYRNMLRTFGKKGALIAVVSDSYDLWNAISNIWGGPLKDEVLAMGGRLVIRPDSGDPVAVVQQAVQLLGDKFGYTLNSKGFRVLHPAVRVIQGDGITYETIAAILRRLQLVGWSAENVSFGMGGGLLQQVNRDTLGFAMKCSAVCVNGVWRDVYKDPVTDPGKRSKRGQLALVTETGRYATVSAEGNAWRNELKEVFHNGVLRRRTTFAEIRERARQPMVGDR